MDHLHQLVSLLSLLIKKKFLSLHNSGCNIINMYIPLRDSMRVLKMGSFRIMLDWQNDENWHSITPSINKRSDSDEVASMSLIVYTLKWHCQINKWVLVSENKLSDLTLEGSGSRLGQHKITKAFEFRKPCLFLPPVFWLLVGNFITERLST